LTKAPFYGIIYSRKGRNVMIAKGDFVRVKLKTSSLYNKVGRVHSVISLIQEGNLYEVEVLVKGYTFRKFYKRHEIRLVTKDSFREKKGFINYLKRIFGKGR